MLALLFIQNSKFIIQNSLQSPHPIACHSAFSPSVRGFFPGSAGVPPASSPSPLRKGCGSHRRNHPMSANSQRGLIYPSRFIFHRLLISWFWIPDSLLLPPCHRTQPRMDFRTVAPRLVALPLHPPQLPFQLRDLCPQIRLRRFGIHRPSVFRRSLVRFNQPLRNLLRRGLDCASRR